MGWQWGQCPWKRFPYIRVSDVLCYKPIPIIYRTSLLQNSLKVIIEHFSVTPVIAHFMFQIPMYKYEDVEALYIMCLWLWTHTCVQQFDFKSCFWSSRTCTMDNSTRHSFRKLPLSFCVRGFICQSVENFWREWQCKYFHSLLFSLYVWKIWVLDNTFHVSTHPPLFPSNIPFFIWLFEQVFLTPQVVTSLTC